MQVDNISYIVQAKAHNIDKWGKVFESSGYDKISKFYKEIKNDVYIFNDDEKSFFLFSKKANDIIFSYNPDMSQISPSRWVNIEAVDINNLSDKICDSLPALSGEGLRRILLK
jgi:hypothetical protein